MDEPALSFNQSALKVVWSNILIDNLNRQCVSFIEAKPYRIGVKPDPSGGDYHFEVGLTEQIPPAIALLAGDICGNLRASLDYAWMGVIRRENPDQSDKRTLPIADNRKGLISALPKAPIKIAVKDR